MRARIPLSSVRILLLVLLASVVVILGTCSRGPAVAASLDQGAAQAHPAQTAPAPPPAPNPRTGIPPSSTAR
jgi:hypothetical protein